MKYKKRTPEERHQEIIELTDRLKTGTLEYLQSDRYKELLDAFSRFHEYSFRNSLLIYLQRPDSTYTASYTTWKSLNRQVLKGSKGIKIFAPLPQKIQETKEKIDPMTNQPVLKSNGDPELKTKTVKRIKGYKVAYTFDISDTQPIDNGRPTPNLEIVHDLNGDVDGYEKLKNAIIKFSPVPITFADFDGSAKGYYSPSEKKIVIRSNHSMSEVQTIKTMLHEVCHSLLHSQKEIKNREEHGLPELSPEVKECQAESCAYVTASHYGLDTSSYSFPYVATWLADTNDNPKIFEKKMMDQLEVIKDTSAKMINGIDYELELQQKEELTKSLSDRTISFLQKHDPKFGENELYKGSYADEIRNDISHLKTDKVIAKINRICTDEVSKAESRELIQSISNFKNTYKEDLEKEHTRSHSRSM